MSAPSLSRTLARRTGDAYCIGYASASAGISSYAAGRFREARDGSDEALRIWQESSRGAGWETSTTELSALNSGSAVVKVSGVDFSSAAVPLSALS